MSTRIVLVPGQPGHQIRLDVDACGDLFATFKQTLNREVGAALKTHAARLHLIEDDTALTMRKNADGVFVLEPTKE